LRLHAAIVLVVVAPALCQDGALVLRAFEQPPAGRAIGVNSQGVQVRSPQGDVVVVGWDRVLKVPQALHEAAEAYEQLALDSWRARSRLERGDLVLAEPVLQALFEASQNESQPLRGPTGMMIAEGLVRTRLARGASTAAIEPWLAWIDASIVRQPRTTFAHRAWASEAGLTTAIDPATELSPWLPPIWLDSPALQLVFQLEPSEDERKKTSAMRALYQAAARHESGERVDALPEVPREAAVELVRDIVAARVLDESARASARARLQAALADANEPWRTAWIRAAIGRSLVLETDEEDRLRGVAQLLRVHVLHRGDLPGLADVALAEAAVTLHELGQANAARGLAHELMQDTGAIGATSAVLSWPKLAILLERPSPTGSAAPSSTESATAGGPP